MNLKPFLFVLVVFNCFTWLESHVTVGNVQLAPALGLGEFPSIFTGILATNFKCLQEDFQF